MATQTMTKPKTEKPAPVLVDHDHIANAYAKVGTLWRKHVTTFDHQHVKVEAWFLLVDDPKGGWTASWTTYDGTLSKSKVRPLDLAALARPLLEAPGNVQARLMGRSYRIFAPAAPAEPEAPEKRRGRPRKGGTA